MEAYLRKGTELKVGFCLVSSPSSFKDLCSH